MILAHENPDDGASFREISYKEGTSASMLSLGV